MKKLGFGLMRLPLLDQNDAGSIDIEETKRMVDTFLEKGFTYFVQPGCIVPLRVRQRLRQL